MIEEDAFIRAIVAEPSDLARRLVYADWLEERGDDRSRARAEYLRLECELDQLPRADSGECKIRLLDLRMLVGDDWWPSVDRAENRHFFVALLSASERDSILALVVRAYLDPLGLTQVAPRRWVDGSRPPVRRLFDFDVLYGGLSTVWGFSLDFVPQLSGNITYWP